MKITTPALLFFFFSVNLLDLFLRIKLLSKIGSTLVDPQQKKKKKKRKTVFAAVLYVPTRVCTSGDEDSLCTCRQRR